MAERRTQPTTYYSEISGVGRAIKHYRHEGKKGLAIGAVGLGVGTLAAYMGDGDTITFYEINQSIIEIAESGRWFSYLTDCEKRGAVYDVRLGDARLTLDRELADTNAKKYDVLVLDAFSGDAIPAHLLTEEAFGIYIGHLATAEAEGRDGAIAVHITNRYVDLEPVVRGLGGAVWAQDGAGSDAAGQCASNLLFGLDDSYQGPVAHRRARGCGGAG